MRTTDAKRQRSTGELLLRRSEQLAAKRGANSYGLRVGANCELPTQEEANLHRFRSHPHQQSVPEINKILYNIHTNMALRGSRSSQTKPSRRSCEPCVQRQARTQSTLRYQTGSTTKGCNPSLLKCERFQRQLQLSQFRIQHAYAVSNNNGESAAGESCNRTPMHTVSSLRS